VIVRVRDLLGDEAAANRLYQLVAGTVRHGSESDLALHPEEQGVVVHVGHSVRRAGDRHFADLRYIGLKLHVVAAEVPVDAAGVLPRALAAIGDRRDAAPPDWLPVGIGMWPRGEVGSAVLVLWRSHGIAGRILAVAVLSLALSLLLTRLFIWLMERVLAHRLPERLASLLAPPTREFAPPATEACV